MLSEDRMYDSRGGKNIGWYEGGDYIYEKDFQVPELYEDQTVILEFEGVYHDGDVLLNGMDMGNTGYGYNGCFVCLDGA